MSKRQAHLLQRRRLLLAAVALGAAARRAAAQAPAQQDPWPSLAAQIFNGRKNRLRFHYHSLTASERCVVHDVMFVRGPVPKVMDTKIDNPIFLSAFHDAFAKRRATDVGKQCQDVDLHFGRKR